MWGTCFIIDDLLANRLETRRMCSDTTELREEIDYLEDEEKAKIERALDDEDNEWNVLEEYIDEEMAGARNILDNQGNTTAMYLHEVKDKYVISINGAGYNFYYGVWDKLYDSLGLKWHDYKN